MLVQILTLSIAGVTAWWCLQQRKGPKRYIEDEVVVIVGASSGVGLETAKLFAKSWQETPRRRLHIVARRPEIHHIKDEIVTATGCKHVEAHVADACSVDDIATLARNLHHSCGKVDTLIFCAGALTTRSFVDLTRSPESAVGQNEHDSGVADPSHPARPSRTVTAVLQASYNANVLSCINTVDNLFPLLKLSSQPRIAVLSSVAAEIPAPTRSIYAAHKAALSMFLRCLRIELDSVTVGKGSGGSCQGIGISIIHPASIKTGLRGKSLDARSGSMDESKAATHVEEHEKSAMDAAYVAKQVKRAVDLEIDEMWLPSLYWWVSKVGMVIAPGFIAWKAKKKYKWSVSKI